MTSAPTTAKAEHLNEELDEVGTPFLDGQVHHWSRVATGHKREAGICLLRRRVLDRHERGHHWKHNDAREQTPPVQAALLTGRFHTLGDMVPVHPTLRHFPFNFTAAQAAWRTSD